MRLLCQGVGHVAIIRMKRSKQSLRTDMRLRMIAADGDGLVSRPAWLGTGTRQALGQAGLWSLQFAPPKPVKTFIGGGRTSVRCWDPSNTSLSKANTVTIWWNLPEANFCPTKFFPTLPREVQISGPGRTECEFWPVERGKEGWQSHSKMEKSGPGGGKGCLISWSRIFWSLLYSICFNSWFLNISGISYVFSI